MQFFDRLWMRIRMLFTRRRAAVQLDDELRFHLDRQIAENRVAGMNAQEARTAALRLFGNPALLRDQARAAWSWNGFESFLRDLRYSARTLRRTPGFTIIAVLVMALGTGTNVALFTVVRGVLLRPLPFKDPDRLAMLYERASTDAPEASYSTVAPGMYAEWKKQNHCFSDLALVRGSRVGLSGSGGQLPEKLVSAEFSWDVLSALGVRPVLGRGFTAADDAPSANATALLSWSLFERRFGGDASTLNKTVYIDAMPYTVIGVMPAWFDFPDTAAQLWTPVYHDRPQEAMAKYDKHTFSVIGRLKPGVTSAQAIAELSTISRRIHNQHLDNPFVFPAAALRPLLEYMVGDLRKPLYMLLAATCCVLLIACLNVANLLVARAAARSRELAVRAALGGSWMSLMRVRILEGLLLSTGGGALGMVLAAAALAWLIRTRSGMSRVDSIHIDGVMAVFTVGVVVLCALASAMITAFSSGGGRALASLQEASRSASGGWSRATPRRVLLALEVGLTVLLLIGAGLLLKSYERLRSVDMGCDTENILTMHIGLPDARYKRPGPAPARFYDTLLQHMRALPGVDAAAFVDAVPGLDYSQQSQFTIAEHPPLPQGQGLAAINRTADPGYFAAIGIPILRGRTFNPSLRLDQANEMVISDSFAKRFFPGEDPLGKHIDTSGRRFTVVGIVGDTRFAVGEEPRPMWYVSLWAGQETVGTLVLRSRQNVEQFALPVQRIVGEMDPGLVVSDILTMNQLLGKSTLNQSFNATLLLTFAVLSLLLAAAGLFGVMAYIVAQRTSEIAIRMALGAPRVRVLGLMLLDGLRPALIGLVLGLAASAAVVRQIQSMLYQTSPLDPAVFAAVAAVLLAVATIACLLPAWRAAHIDPMRALRTE